MNSSSYFDLTYISIDSLSEGVGSSQIIPLIFLLSKENLKINLVTFEKVEPRPELISRFSAAGVDWNFQEFGSNGILGGITRYERIKEIIPNTSIIHARSDIPAVSAIHAQKANVLWDVRSLWADQKVLIQRNIINRSMYSFYRKLEKIAARDSAGMSTLTEAIVPTLEVRNKVIPKLRTVVPTTVDLKRFSFSSQMPREIRALFSGTYNDYYDLNLSASFLKVLQRKFDLDIHWARPLESSKFKIDVGESKIINSNHLGMANLIPQYSFGVSVCRSDAGDSLKAAVPTKIAEFLACGRPVVVNKGLGDMDNMLAEFDVGVALDGSESNLLEAVDKFASLLIDKETPIRCRALAEKYFNMEIGVKKYVNLYTKIINSDF